MKMLQVHSKKGSYIHDIQNVASRLGLDISTIITSKKYLLVSTDNIVMDPGIENHLKYCLNNWHEADARKTFIEFMEERVVREY